MAVIGTGRMGGAMASSIVRGGFDVVLWNRDATKSERLAASLDMPVAATAAEAASKADVVVTSLADDAALERVQIAAALDDVIGGAVAEGLDRHLLRPLSGQHHDRHRRVGGAQRIEDLHSESVREIVIDDS